VDFQLSKCQHHMFFGSEKLGRFRIFPKGRRLGATRGASIAFIKWMLEGNYCLWGDTINSNIDRYVERYFKPFLEANGIAYTWQPIKKLLKVGSGYTDFRSSDRPENWEGFGYNKIFLNEAGIILNSEYLYLNAVLPMMLDFKDSQLIAAGTPKLLKGKGKYFYELYQKAVRKEPGYYAKTFSTYDNPFISIEQIKELEATIPANERKQEIYGEFVLKGGSLLQMSWFQVYSKLPLQYDSVVQSWDTASKGEQINDPSVCTTWYIINNTYYLVDVFRGWLKYPELKHSVITLADKYEPDIILIEDKSSGMALIQDLKVSEFYYSIQPITPTADKVTRMSTASLAIEVGRVFLPTNAEWLHDYEDELLSFPAGEHDDQVDSTSQFLNWNNRKTEVLIG